MNLFGEEEAEEPAALFDLPDPPKAALPPLPRLYGHQAVLDGLLTKIRNRNAPHSLIIDGRKGIGKATLATHLACTLYGLPYPTFNAEDEGNASRWSMLAHPDLLIVEPAIDERKNERRTDILQDDVKTVTPFLRRTSAYGGVRLVIIDDASAMNERAQNVLLKILEEPPVNSLLVLVTHAIGELIPTIRSRCQVLTLSPLNDADMTACIAAQGRSLPPRYAGVILTLADGAPGHALALLDTLGEEGIDTAFEILNGAALMRAGDMLDKTDRLAADKNSDAILNFIDETLAAVLMAQGGRAKALTAFLPHLKEDTKARLEQAGLNRLMAMRDTLAERRRLCENGNLDKKVALQAALRLLGDTLR